MSTMTGCHGCRHDDHCGRQLDVDRSVGCVEWASGETCETCRYRGTYGCLLSGGPLRRKCIHWQPMPVTSAAGTGCAPECSHPEHKRPVVSRVEWLAAARDMTERGSVVAWNRCEERERAATATAKTGTLREPHPLLALIERLREDATRLEDGPIRSALERFGDLREATALRRVADELVALTRGDHP